MFEKAKLKEYLPGQKDLTDPKINNIMHVDRAWWVLEDPGYPLDHAHVVFVGMHAEHRAREYQKWINSRKKRNVQ